MDNGVPKTDFIAVAEPSIGIVGLLFVSSHSDSVSNAFIAERCANIGFVKKGGVVTFVVFVGMMPSIIEIISRIKNFGTVIVPGFKKCIFNM